MSSPASSTSRRRPRDDDDRSDTHFEDAVADQPNKRPRYDNQDASEEDEDEEITPVLPDNYRRSPKGKGRARDTTILANDGPARQHHQPGSIVRVKLTDFVTYSSAEFHPGPNLNMVIGPNGTGKSTLVCAICIGLGWNTSHLGRAKDITEFVKHGKKSAEIEIELKADPARHSENQVISHIINKDGGNKNATKSVFRINGKKSGAKEVQTLARSFSIQVDNLCQFLPQDRVVEFAALSPVDLLVQTQRAAAPEYMSQRHDQLKEMGKEHKQKQAEQQTYIDDLKKSEDRQRAQEGTVTRLRERNTLQERIKILDKMKPFAEYKAKIEQLKEAKKSKKAAAAEFKRLRDRMAPNLKAVQAKEEYHDRLVKYTDAQTRMLTRFENETSTRKRAMEATTVDIDACETELNTERKNGKAARDNLSRLSTQVRQLQNTMRNPPAAFDPSEMNEKIQDRKKELRAIDGRMEETKNTMEQLTAQARQRQQIVEDEEKKKEHLQSQAGQQISRLQSKSKEVAQAWQWVQQNRDKFEGEVYGPPMVECTVKNKNHINAVEAVLGASELLCITVTTQKDFRELSNQLYNHLRYKSVAIRSINRPLSSFRAPCSDDEMRRLGGQQWIVDLLDGPDAVLAMLCDNRGINSSAFTTASVTDAHFEALRRSEIGALVTPSKMFTVSRRREYGDVGTSTRLVEVRTATHLGDVPIDTQEEQDINRHIAARRDEIETIKQEIAGCNTHYNQLKNQKRALTEERDELQKEKDAKQEQKTQFEGLQPKLDKAERLLQETRQSVQQQSARRMAILDKHDSLVMKKGQQALDYGRSIESLQRQYVSVFEAGIMRIEAKSDLEQLEARHHEERALLEQTEEEFNRFRTSERTLLDEGRVLETQCRAVVESFTPAEQEYHTAHNGSFSIEQINSDIEQVQAQLESLHGGNDSVIKEFEERARHIERKREQLRTTEESVNELSTKITELRGSWEPELDQIIGQISEAFAENFSRINCAGEVAVHKDEDFEQWAIEIRVKFRENEQLSVLDAHRQSGGERAVSTIFYLMALQSLARAPFRVVDEINQGMDPRNERLVHSRMVEIACAEHTSQYFLITPKLLNNLTYHKNMKVHCIASGEYMPSDYRELDFGMLAKRALQVKAGAS